MSAVKQALPYQQHQHLRMAAAAARATLLQLQREYQVLVQRATNITESMQRLQGVIEAWERISLEESGEYDDDGGPLHPWPRDGFAPQTEVTERVHAVLLSGLALSAAETHAAIEARFHMFDSLSAVGTALREGVIVGRYVYNGRTGQYRLAAG
ncbi:MAG TPA: hypothetical protein VGN52_21315 [Burkholderiales bacterium]|jgi:hypothetical protein